MPTSMSRGQRSWAALVGATVFWLSKTADEFGRMMVNRRFWPTNLVRRMRVIPQQFYNCRHMPIHVEYGSRGHGRWWVYGQRNVRVAGREVDPGGPISKDERIQAARQPTAARSS